MKSAHKDNSKAWWDEKYSQAPIGLYGKEPSKFLIAQKGLLPKDAKILDVASGEGRNAVALASAGFQVTGLDFSPTALERAEKLAAESNQKVNFKNVDLDMYLPELMAFSAIAIIDYKPAKTFISNVARGLAKDGYLFVEGHLVEACKAQKNLEVFECFQPNELIRQFTGPQGSFRILFYSELESGSRDKVFLVAQKTQLF
jgi:cyclopropane fatty-acyl-phospholipid synthase-like methyltransferase